MHHATEQPGQKRRKGELWLQGFHFNVTFLRFIQISTLCNSSVWLYELERIMGDFRPYLIVIGDRCDYMRPKSIWATYSTLLHLMKAWIQELLPQLLRIQRINNNTNLTAALFSRVAVSSAFVHLTMNTLASNV